MRAQSIHQRALLVFGLSLAFAVSFCYGTVKTVEVMGIGECADCAQRNIKTSEALSGLQVTVDCKNANGKVQIRGVGELQEDGKFIVSLPEDIVQNGKLKEECYAVLHGASSAACPAHAGSLEASKIVSISSTAHGKQAFATAGKLKFSPVTCTSAFLWPHFKFPPLDKIAPWKKKFGHSFPFHPIIKKPDPEPKLKNPNPKPEPKFKRPDPEDKPKPKPKSKSKSKSKPQPKFKKSDPDDKPKPKFKQDPKKPCPIFPFLKFPPFNKIPSKYFPHPKFGSFPHFPPNDSHP